MGNTARQIYLRIKDNPDQVAQVRGWGAELAMACMDPNQAMETTSFTLNGQSGAGQLRATKAQLLSLVSSVIWQLDNAAALSTRTTGVTFNADS